MKKVFYSVYTKLAVVVLFVICIVSGAVIASDGIIIVSSFWYNITPIIIATNIVVIFFK